MEADQGRDPAQVIGGEAVHPVAPHNIRSQFGVAARIHAVAHVMQQAGRLQPVPIPGGYAEKGAGGVEQLQRQVRHLTRMAGFGAKLGPQLLDRRSRGKCEWHG